ncbi:hypothetical protein LXA43DRAFT_636058 [Ganoderma leucocontextum]|nr:hypothetical protein LXA43DRAFT_636058 [Ganoderma leucocontextum]
MSHCNIAYVYNSSKDASVSWAALLNEDASSLRALAIMPVLDWMPSCTFPHLTHLLISFDRKTALYHPFDLLHLLINTPVLAFLHVDFLLFGGRYLGDWQPPSDLVPLRHLSSLVFTSCSYELVHTFISRLSLPEDVFMRLQDIYNGFNFDGYPAPPILPVALRPVTSLDLSMRGEQILMVADGSTSGLWFEGYRDIAGAPVGWVAWLLRLHECLPLSHVTYLHVYIDGEPICWLEFLAQMPQVSDLAVLLGGSSGPPNVKVTVLSPTTILCRALSPSPTAPIRCPVLRSLTVEWQEEITLETASTFLHIPAMLTGRARAGHPIRHVVVQAAWRFLSSDAGPVIPLFQYFEPLVRPDDTKYEIVKKEDGVSGLCVFNEMRDVWKIDGEDRYWDINGDIVPNARYHLPYGVQL